MKAIILRFVINWLEQYASQTETTIDDQLVEMLKAWIEGLESGELKSSEIPEELRALAEAGFDELKTIDD